MILVALSEAIDHGRLDLVVHRWRSPPINRDRFPEKCDRSVRVGEGAHTYTLSSLHFPDNTVAQSVSAQTDKHQGCFVLQVRGPSATNVFCDFLKFHSIIF